jgi:glycosyltransferase involved in cell wall biosynthesis
MRILLGSFYSGPHEGGAEKQGRLLAEEFGRRGLDVRYVTASLPGGETFLASERVQVHRIPVGPRIPGFSRTVGEALYCLGLKRFLAENAGRCDVLHALGAFEVTAPLMASNAARSGARSLLRFASLGELDFLRTRSPLGRLLWRRALAADWYVGNSAPVRDTMVRTYGLPEDRCAVIGNAVIAPPSVPRAEARASLGWDGGRPSVLCVSKFDPLKNQELLVRAWPGVLARVPEARLFLAGDGPRLGRCRRLAEELGIAGSVSWLGRVTSQRVGLLLRACDVFAFPSQYEGQPNALLEAMAAGLPCAMSDIPGNRSLAEPEIESARFDPASSEGAAEAVAGLLLDPARAARLGRSAAERARRDHGLERVADAYLALYRRMVQPTGE